MTSKPERTAEFAMRTQGFQRNRKPRLTSRERKLARVHAQSTPAKTRGILASLRHGASRPRLRPGLVKPPCNRPGREPTCSP